MAQLIGITQNEASKLWDVTLSEEGRTIKATGLDPDTTEWFEENWNAAWAYFVDGVTKETGEGGASYKEL